MGGERRSVRARRHGGGPSTCRIPVGMDSQPKQAKQPSMPHQLAGPRRPSTRFFRRLRRSAGASSSSNCSCPSTPLLPMGRRQCALCRTWIEATALSPKEGDFARCKTVDTTPWTRTRTGEGESVCCSRQAARGPWMDGASPLLHHPDACGATAAWAGGVGCDRMHHPLVVARVLGLHSI